MCTSTNISFGLELVLKAFLMQSGIRKFGHDLVSLYGLLNIDLKNKIIEHYKGHDTYKSYIAIQLISSNGDDHGKINKIYSLIRDEKQIAEMLEAHKLAFSSFRYLHEIQRRRRMVFSL